MKYNLLKLPILKSEFKRREKKKILNKIVTKKPQKTNKQFRDNFVRMFELNRTKRDCQGTQFKWKF